MVFKNNPGKEENTHSGSEKKFPWWYFLHTHGGFGLANEEPAYTRGRQLPFTQRHLRLLLFPCLVFPHFQCRLLSLPLSPHLSATLPPLPFLYPSFNVSRSLSQLFLCARTCNLRLSTSSFTLWRFSCVSTQQISDTGHIPIDLASFCSPGHLTTSTWTSDTYILNIMKFCNLKVDGSAPEKQDEEF